MNEPNENEAISEFFARRARELAAEVGAKVESLEIGPDELLVVFELRGKFNAFSVPSVQGESAVARAKIERYMPKTVDALCAATSVEIPAGAVWMENGSRIVFGPNGPLDPEELPPPIVAIDRIARTYRRRGDESPRPWPPIWFRTEGRQGFVERAP